MGVAEIVMQSHRRGLYVECSAMTKGTATFEGIPGQARDDCIYCKNVCIYHLGFLVFLGVAEIVTQSHRRGLYVECSAMTKGTATFEGILGQARDDCI